MQKPDIKKLNTKLIVKIIAAVFIIVTVLFTGAFIFIKAYGKVILIDKLSAAFEKPVTIGEISVAYPLGLKIRNLKVEGYGFVKEADVGLGVWHLLDRNSALSTVILIEPQVVIHHTKEGKIVFGEMPKEEMPVLAPPANAPEGQGGAPAVAVTPAPVETSVPKQKTADITIDKLVVKNGTIDFFGHSSAENIFALSIRGVNFRSQKASFTLEGRRVKFDLTALIVGQDKRTIGGRVESRGWINLAKKDMNGDFKIVNLDGRIFSLFYGETMNKRFKNITADLSAHAESTNNDMIVKGKLTVKNFEFNIQEDKETKKFFPEDLLLGSFQSMAKGMSIDFKFKTKMDNFKMESVSFSGNIFN